MRYDANGQLKSVTISSETTAPLSRATIGWLIDSYAGPDAASGPVVFRTPAVTRAEAVNYEQSGFVTTSVLRLLAHDLGERGRKSSKQRRRAPDLNFAKSFALRRGRTADLVACMAIDERAFGRQRRFDHHDLAAALDATERSRLRIAVDTAGAPLGFAITGRAGGRGYLQRLAVDPEHASNGIGTALVFDGLAWCQRRGVRRTVVNTQEDNGRALDLYRRLGFVDMALELFLLERQSHGS